MNATNPVGAVLEGPAALPERITTEGEYVSLVPLDAVRHAPALWEGMGGAESESLWRYMGDGPFLQRETFEAHLERKAASDDPLLYTIVSRASERPAGVAALMRIKPRHRVIEVGNIVYTSALQRTREATEAMYLLARYVFEDLGYRRYEWKCNTLNEASQRAARRLGFSFEGIFRQHMIVKGRNRDTAWFAMLDSEWPARKREFERWLELSNFDEEGRQRTALSMPKR
jgi:RimJ/RimL family protein N-acetyltransferase